MVMKFHSFLDIFYRVQKRRRRLLFILTARMEFYHALLPLKLARFLNGILTKLLINCKRDIEIQIVDFLLGIVSGIPVCCTFYFSLKSKGTPFRTWHPYPERIPFGIQYVPCPRCTLKSKWVHDPKNRRTRTYGISLGTLSFEGRWEDFEPRF